jgi:hypothetical protein
MRPVIQSHFTLFFGRVVLILETEEVGAYIA